MIGPHARPSPFPSGVVERCEDCRGILSRSLPHRCLWPVLLESLGGLELSDQQERVLHWLASWDTDTVEPIAALFRKCRAEGSSHG